jgi:uncharacterized membrane protein
MELEPWLHLVHIGGAIVWVGGGLMLTIVGSRARQSGDMAVMSHFARMLSLVGLRVFAPSVLVVVASGVWLVITQSREFTELWVLLALAAFAAAFVIGALVQRRNAIALERVTTGPEADPSAARAALGRWIVGNFGVLVILTFAVWDMVFKPGT